MLKHGRRLALHNPAGLSESWLDGQQLYEGLKSVKYVGVDVDDVPIPFHAADGCTTCPSVLIHPIAVLGQTVGAIVCSGRKGPLFIFRERDDKGIELVARMLGNQWFNIEQQATAASNRQMLSRASIANLEFNRAVNDQLQARADRTINDGFIDLALTALDQIAAVEPFSSARLPDLDGTFRFSSIRHGEKWKDSDIQARADERRFAVSGGPADEAGTAAEYVYRTRQPATVDAANPPIWYFDTFKRHFAWALYIPVFRAGANREMVAILDVRSSEPQPFPPSMTYVAQRLAEHLGVILALVDRRRELYAQNQELQREKDSQAQAFNDLDHQILESASHCAEPARFSVATSAVRPGNAGTGELSQHRACTN